MMTPIQIFSIQQSKKKQFKNYKYKIKVEKWKKKNLAKIAFCVVFFIFCSVIRCNQKYECCGLESLVYVYAQWVWMVGEWVLNCAKKLNCAIQNIEIKNKNKKLTNFEFKRNWKWDWCKFSIFIWNSVDNRASSETFILIMQRSVLVFFCVCALMK